MKKIFLILCVLGFAQNVFGQELDSSDPREEKTISEEIIQLTDKLENPSFLKKTFSKFKEIACKSPEKINSFLDTILTKKGALKTLLIVGIPVAIYCYYFPPEILDSLLIKISSAAAKGASYVASGTTKGLLVGIGQGIKENKEELKNIFAENKEEIKTLVNDLTYEIEYMKKDATLSAELASASSGFFSPVRSFISKLATGASIAIPFAIQTMVTGYLKKRYNFK